jgi:siroheme synthase
MRAGLPASTPAAAVHGGTTSSQQKVISSLAELASAVSEAGLQSPVTTIIGDVVKLSNELDWFLPEGQQVEGAIAYDSLNLARA